MGGKEGTGKPRKDKKKKPAKETRSSSDYDDLFDEDDLPPLDDEEIESMRSAVASGRAAERDSDSDSSSSDSDTSDASSKEGNASKVEVENNVPLSFKKDVDINDGVDLFESSDESGEEPHEQEYDSELNIYAADIPVTKEESEEEDEDVEEEEVEEEEVVEEEVEEEEEIDGEDGDEEELEDEDGAQEAEQGENEDEIKEGNDEEGNGGAEVEQIEPLIINLSDDEEESCSVKPSEEDVVSDVDQKGAQLPGGRESGKLAERKYENYEENKLCIAFDDDDEDESKSNSVNADVELATEQGPIPPACNEDVITEDNQNGLNSPSSARPAKVRCYSPDICSFGVWKPKKCFHKSDSTPGASSPAPPSRTKPETEEKKRESNTMGTTDRCTSPQPCSSQMIEPRRSGRIAATKKKHTKNDPQSDFLDLVKQDFNVSEEEMGPAKSRIRKKGQTLENDMKEKDAATAITSFVNDSNDLYDATPSFKRDQINKEKTKELGPQRRERKDPIDKTGNKAKHGTNADERGSDDDHSEEEYEPPANADPEVIMAAFENMYGKASMNTRFMAFTDIYCRPLQQFDIDNITKLIAEHSELGRCSNCGEKNHPCSCAIAINADNDAVANKNAKAKAGTSTSGDKGEEELEGAVGGVSDDSPPFGEAVKMALGLEGRREHERLGKLADELTEKYPWPKKEMRKEYKDLTDQERASLEEEMKATHEVWSQLHQQNATTLRTLQLIAKWDLRRSEAQKKLSETEAELGEFYKHNAPGKRIPPRQKEQILKLLQTYEQQKQDLGEIMANAIEAIGAEVEFGYGEPSPYFTEEALAKAKQQKGKGRKSSKKAKRPPYCI